MAARRASRRSWRSSARASRSPTWGSARMRSSPSTVRRGKVASSRPRRQTTGAGPSAWARACTRSCARYGSWPGWAGPGGGRPGGRGSRGGRGGRRRGVRPRVVRSGELLAAGRLARQCWVASAFPAATSSICEEFAAEIPGTAEASATMSSRRRRSWAPCHSLLQPRSVRASTAGAMAWVQAPTGWGPRGL